MEARIHFVVFLHLAHRLEFEEPARLLLFRCFSRNSFLFSIVDSPAATVDKRASEPSVPIALPHSRAPPTRSPQHTAQRSQTLDITVSRDSCSSKLTDDHLQ